MGFLRHVVIVALALCVVTAPANAQAGPDPVVLRTIESQVTQIRGLAPLSEPDLTLLDHTSLHSYLADEYSRNYLPRERESDQKELAALGLIQPGDDLAQIQLNLLDDQVIGVYDPDAKSLFVVNDEGGFGPAARITYAHEFDHALQDQHYDLSRIAPKHPESNDRSLAVHGIIEGDAVLLQTLWAEQNLTQDDLTQLARTASGGSDTLARAPLIVRAELLFPYTEGFSFVRQIYRQSGNDYTAVNALFARPPDSTAQILHPDRYRGDVQPVDVQLGDVAASMGADWHGVGSGVLGELDTRVLLEQFGISQTEANRIAAGWSGDRWQLVENGGQDAIVLESVWQSPAAADGFFAAYARTLQTRYPDASLDDSSETRQALTTSTSATDVRVEGSTVLAVIAPDRATADAIVTVIPAPSDL